MHAVRKTLAALAAGVGLAVASAASWAAPTYVNALGAQGWTSGDTRNATGGPADAGQIAQQIQFVDGPAGAVNGALRLYGTTENAGKSDLGLLNANGLAGASALLGTDFTLSYRAFSEPLPTARTVGLGLSVSDGLSYFTFSHVDTGTNGNQNTWREDTVTATTGTFRLYGASGALDAGVYRTLAEWAAISQWASLFSEDYDLVRVNFNLGSSQRNAAVYVDWLESNLLNGGDRIDFVSADFVVPQPVPEPVSLALFGVALAGLGLARRRQAS